MAQATAIKPGTDARKNWRVINDLVAQIRRIDVRLTKLEQRFEHWTRKPEVKDRGGDGGNKFKGEYNQAVVYETGDMVKISGGPQAGTYIKTASSVAGKHPSEGEVWAKLGNVLDDENWV